MNAFIVSHTHIDAIVTFALRHYPGIAHNPRVPETVNPDVLGQLLYAENVRSVDHQQNERHIVEPYRWRAYHGEATSPVDVLKLLHCLEHQSCECPDYARSVAYQTLEILRQRTVRLLPGYDGAVWTINEADEPLVPRVPLRVIRGGRP